MSARPACLVRLPAVVAAACVLVPLHGQERLTRADDRAAFRAWFVMLADAQFYRTTADVGDCAALVRHAVREALRPHTGDWAQRLALPLPAVAPDVEQRLGAAGDGLALFRVSSGEPPAFAEFADARTIVRLNSRPLGRDVRALAPGDLLYFHNPSRRQPDHLMVFVGRSVFEPDGDDWVVYHTGPVSRPVTAGDAAGEVRKVRLADLLRHPSARWRPVAGNASFVGVFRLLLM